MRLRFVLLGLIGTSVITLVIGWFLFHLLYKKKIQSKKQWFLMLLAFLLGFSCLFYSGKQYIAIKYLKEKPLFTVKIDNQLIQTNANAKERVMLPTAYQTIENTHPSIVSLPKDWHGYKYWMAVTAYPKGEAFKENPHVFASNDLITWEQPAKNPLDEVINPKRDKNNQATQYNSDTHIIFNEERNQLELFWRYVDADADKVIIYQISSVDGKNWGNKKEIYSGSFRKSDMLSPAFIKDKHGYKVWFVDHDYKIWYKEASVDFKWSEKKEIHVPYQDKSKNMKHWHIDVQQFEDDYEMLVVGFEDNPNLGKYERRHIMNLYYSYSKDNQTWADLKPIIYPSQRPNQFDGKGIYRSAFIKENNQYYIFYSGIGLDDTRGIGLSYGKDIFHLTGIDYSDYHLLY